MISFGSLFASPRSSRGADPSFFHSQDTLRPARQQPSPQHVEVGQGERGKGPNRVLVDAAVAHLGEAPQTLDDVEGVLASSTSARTGSVDQLLMPGELVPGLGLAVYPVADAGVLSLHAMVFAPVSLIAIQLRLLPVQQFVHARDVGLVGRTRSQAMHHPLLGGADVKLHAEIPLLALARLTHLGVALLLGILRRTGC